MLFQGPEVIIDNPDLNFGLVRLGDSVEMCVIIRNQSQVSAKWSIKESDVHASQEENAVSFMDFEILHIR